MCCFHVFDSGVEKCCVGVQMVFQKGESHIWVHFIAFANRTRLNSAESKLYVLVEADLKTFELSCGGTFVVCDSASADRQSGAVHS